MKACSIAALAALSFTAVGCGGGDDGSAQDEVADMMIEFFTESGAPVDEDCLRDAVGKLSDADAKLIRDAGPEGDPEVSDSANDAADAMNACFEAMDG